MRKLALSSKLVRPCGPTSNDGDGGPAVYGSCMYVRLPHMEMTHSFCKRFSHFKGVKLVHNAWFEKLFMYPTITGIKCRNGNILVKRYTSADDFLTVLLDKLHKCN